MIMFKKGYGAVTMANALKSAVTEMPELLWQSLTWDRGKELSDHARFTVESGVKVFFDCLDSDSARAWPLPIFVYFELDKH
jgi:IS30 family transposase